MTSHPTWDPHVYHRFAGERGRAFFELTGRVAAERPARVADLGCGTGELTAALAERWPEALVEGLDRSSEMIARAEPLALPGRLRFATGDVRDWRPDSPVDVVVSNAALHWVPDHADLLPGWVEMLAPGGWLAFQVPGTERSPGHTILAELQASPRWRDRLRDVAGGHALEPAEYLDLLAGLGCAVDTWETTYLHVLQGEDAVLEWRRGSTLRPVLSVLDGGERDEFLAEYGARLRAVYPPGAYGTVLPFRRIFVVARRSG